MNGVSKGGGGCQCWSPQQVVGAEAAGRQHLVMVSPVARLWKSHGDCVDILPCKEENVMPFVIYCHIGCHTLLSGLGQHGDGQGSCRKIRY